MLHSGARACTVMWLTQPYTKYRVIFDFLVFLNCCRGRSLFEASIPTSYLVKRKLITSRLLVVVDDEPSNNQFVDSSPLLPGLISTCAVLPHILRYTLFIYPL